MTSHVIVYGHVPDDLRGEISVPAEAQQVSPRVIGAAPLEGGGEGAERVGQAFVHAPASTLERRHVLASVLGRLAVGGTLTAFAGNTKGGARLVTELQAMGCAPAGRHKAKHRIAMVRKPPSGLTLEEAFAAGAPRLLEDLGLWSQPGVFSWDRIDPGSALLLDLLAPLAGRGADLGCGIGILSSQVLKSAEVEALTLVDIDRRAVDLASRNIDDGRARFVWADVCAGEPVAANLDFVVMNPPFHDGGIEDRSIGQAFIRRAAGMLKRGGVLWLTANRHLAYEALLKSCFAEVERVSETNGYKVFRAVAGASVEIACLRPGGDDNGDGNDCPA